MENSTTKGKIGYELVEISESAYVKLVCIQVGAGYVHGAGEDDNIRVYKELTSKRLATCNTANAFGRVRDLQYELTERGREFLDSVQNQTNQHYDTDCENVGLPRHPSCLCLRQENK
jgi:hypothetical protein